MPDTSSLGFHSLWGTGWQQSKNPRSLERAMMLIYFRDRNGGTLYGIPITNCDYPLFDFCFNFSINDDTRTFTAFVLSGSRVITISIMSPSRQSPRKDVGILNVTGFLSCDTRTAKDPSTLSIVAFISVLSIYCSRMLCRFCPHPIREYRLFLEQRSYYNMPVQRLVLKSLHSYTDQMSNRIRSPLHLLIRVGS